MSVGRPYFSNAQEGKKEKKMEEYSRSPPVRKDVGPWPGRSQKKGGREEKDGSSTAKTSGFRILHSERAKAKNSRNLSEPPSRKSTPWPERGKGKKKLLASCF